MRERDHLGDSGVDGRIIFRWIFTKWDVGGMDWIELAQDREKWRALVHLVGKTEGKRPLERPRRRWEDKIILRWIDV